MKLGELLAGIDGVDLANSPHSAIEVTGISTNSQTCQMGDLFIGMPGTRVDGGEFWRGALAKGAIAALITPKALAKNPAVVDQPVFTTPYIILASIQIASKFYDYPAAKLKLVGVTGTNGKTTTTHLIEFILEKAQRSPALLGTLYTRWRNYQATAINTTPFAVELQAQLAQAQLAGSEFAVMEVSSHALVQRRVLGCPFEVAVFTNLTQDHLDFHGTMETYFQAKALLFTFDYLKGKAIINLDNAYGQRLAARVYRDRLWTYSVGNAQADLFMSSLEYTAIGVKGRLHTPLGEIDFTSPLVGQFNLENLLAAVGASLHLGIDLALIAESLPEFGGVPGRMEQVQVPGQDISVIVDYAHTPDSLESLLKAARPFISGKMICVFGCGGDRDRTKRPIMGEIAARLADIAVVTSDNPRTENPQQILQDVLAGIPEGVNVILEGDRATAIRLAIQQAQPGDGVLIAGKGHEDYQILGTEKIHFDDREQARNVLSDRYLWYTPDILLDLTKLWIPKLLNS